MAIKKIKESDVLKTITDWLSYSKIYYLRLNSGRALVGKKMISLCPQGTPDLLVIMPEKIVFFEVKKDQHEIDKWQKHVATFLATSFVAPSNGRDILQFREHERIRKQAKCDVFMVCTVDEVIKNLR